ILLSAFFVLSSFVLFLEFYKNRRAFCLPLAAFTFLGALLCKESAAMLPLEVLGFMALDRTKPWLRKLSCLWPFVAGMAVYLFLRIHFGITAMHQSSRPLVLILGFVTFLRSLITDLRLFIFPVGLHYDRSLPFMLSLAQPQAVFTCLFWAIAAALVVFYHRKISPMVFFLFWWFGLEMFPVSQLVVSIGVGAGHVSTADHFLYVAAVPVFIGMVLAYQKLNQLNAVKNWVQPVFLKILAGGLVAFFLLIAIEQSIYASNEYSMVNRSLQFDPNNSRLQGEMGMLSVFRGDIPNAQQHFQMAIRSDPFNPQYHIALGTALCQQREWIQGLAQYMALDPGKDRDLVDRESRLTMQHIQNQLASGKTFDSRGWLAIGIYHVKIDHDLKAAIEAFKKSAALDPAQTDAWFNLGSLFEATHNRQAAVAAYTKVLGLPQATDFQKNFAAQHAAALK
ncbi:MAG: hypothetical protein KGK03_11190, partial [Candidatus Omnitrophica bacterium]|nr:hypothetical protein [Candidatus Omnitrophota bacterium]